MIVVLATTHNNNNARLGLKKMEEAFDENSARESVSIARCVVREVP